MLKAIAVVAAMSVGVGSYATTINVDYGPEGQEDGFGDPTVVEAVPGNSGVTRGEQATIAFDYAARLVERVVWIDDSIPLRINAGQGEFTEDTAAVATVVSSSTPTLDLFGQASDIPGIVEGYSYPVPLIMALSGRYHERAGEVDGSIQINSEIEWDHSTTFVVDPNDSIAASVPVILHEFIHVLGMDTGINPDGSFLYESQPSIYDRFIVDHEISELPAVEMSQSERSELFGGGDEVRMAGPSLTAAAPMLLQAGQVDGEVFLSGDAEQQALSHVSDTLDPESLMRVAGVETLELGVVAHILSDMGWGPVTDSRISIQPTESGVTLSVLNDQSAENVVVNFAVPDGVSIASVLGVPADCVAAEQSGRCVFEQADAGVEYLIDVTLDGVAGVHNVSADIDLQSLHVDPSPANNFSDNDVQVGTNTILDLILEGGTIDENEPIGSEVGILTAESAAEGISHTFELVAGDGSDHNSCFKIEGDRLQSAVEFDFEGQNEFSILLEATASNGFTLSKVAAVSVSDVGGAQAFNFNFGFGSYAYAGPYPGERGVKKHPFLFLSWAGLMAALVIGMVARSRIVSRSAITLLFLMLITACGGGGGGSSSSVAPTTVATPDPVAFSCP